MKTILVVEDNDTDIMLLEDFLEQAGVQCEMTTFRDGQSAQNFIANLADGHVPALILLDLNIPKIDGTDLLPKIRANQALVRVPVIVWSSANSPRDLAVAEKFGVADFILKPYDLAGWKNLAERLRDFLPQ